MDSNFNFEIRSSAKYSAAFLSLGMRDLKEAMNYIRQLPYGRNPDKKNLMTLFADNCGTCSTKHAVLKELAIENSFPQIKLMLGLFKMNKHNTPLIAGILQQEGLTYIPEAHNYLKIGTTIIDCTFPGSYNTGFIKDIMIETEINPHQITDHKIRFHKDHLEKWLKASSLPFSLQELWQIREHCIAALGT